MSDRFDVIGCEITPTTFDGAVARLLDGVRSGRGGYVCFVNGHLAVTGHEEPAVRSALNGSFMSLPDGRPVYVVGRLKGVAQIEPVPGPDFMEALLKRRADPPLRHFFLGATDEVLARLVEVVRTGHAGAQIAGWYSPPFRALSESEWAEVLQRVRAARADLVWVGLGAPKQELFMAEHWQQLQPAMLLGVGAAFDFLAGSLARAPGWMRKAGLEWLFRLLHEPRRLWRRYGYTNTMFIAYLARDMLDRRGHRQA